MADIARLTQLIETEATALGFELVRVRLSGQGEERTLQVMAEDPATGQLVMGQCAQLSRAISASIDAVEEAEGELVEGAYMLEVGSPGIDRPLTRPKDYAQWIGHDAKIALIEPWEGNKRLVGELAGLDPRGDASCVGLKLKDGFVHFIPLANIHSAKLVLTDKLIAATQPLDMTGADEFDETLPEDETSAEKVQD